MGSRGRGNVRVYIDGDSSGLGRATKQAETHLGRFGSRVSSLGSKMTSAGSTLTKGVTLPVLGIGAVAGKVAIDFDKSMRNVNSIAQLPEKQFHKLEHSVLNLAGPTAQAPKTLADGLYDLVSSGFDAKESLGILGKSAKAATAGLTTTEVSTAAVAAELNAYHLPAKKAGQISDQLFETVNRGVITFEDLASNIGDVLPFASSLGVGMDEVGASISTMTKEGISAPETMTRIKNAMVALIKPGDDLKKAIKATGAASGEALVNQKGFQGALEAVLGTTDGTKESVAALFPNIRGLGGVLALTGGNVRSAQKDLKAFADTSGATDKALGEQKKSLAFKWQKFNAELQKTAIETAPPFLRAGKEILGEVGDMVKSFDELSPSTKNLIIKIGLLGAALGPVLTIGGNLLKVFGGIVSISGKVGRALDLIAPAAATTAGGGGGVVPVGVAGGARTSTTVATTTEKSVGAFGEKKALEDVGLFGGGAAASLGTKLKGVGKALGRTVLGVAGGYVVAELGVHGLKALGVGDPTEGQGIAKSLTHGFNTDHVAETEEQALHQAEGFKPHLDDAAIKKMRTAFHGLMGDLKSDAILGMGNINYDLAQGLHVASATWAKDTPQWHKHTAQAMRAAVHAIKEGMASGTVETKAGQQRINRLLRRIKFVEGNDPTGIGKGMAKSFREAGGVTKQGVRKWVQELSLMPKGAREAAANSTLQMLQQWAQGHPKIEKQVDQLTAMQIRKFGATNKQLREGVKKDATGPVADAFHELAGDVSGALSNIGTNTQEVLRALGVKNLPEFKVALATGGGSKFSGPKESKERHEERFGRRARGGPIDRPMFMVGEEAPQHPEWVIATNPAYRRNNVAYWAQAGHDLGIPGFKKGGAPHLDRPVLSGGTDVLRAGGQKAIDLAYHAGKHLIDEARAAKARRAAASGGVAGYTGPPANMKQLGNSRWVDGHTLAVTAFLDKKFGLSMSSGYRSPQHNAEIGGAPGSLHTHGSPSNPGATDSVGSMGAMQSYIGFAKQHVAGLREAMVDNYAGLGSNAHLGFFAKGGLVTGKVSYFGGGATAGGSDTSKPGIALNLNPGTESGWNNAKTQGWRDDSLAGHPDYARVTIAGKSANLPITDMGPAASTGRAIDVTEGGVRKLGFTTSNFPTDAVGTAEILGGGSGSKESAQERKEKTPVHGRTKLSFEEKSSRLDTRIAKAETTAGLKDDRRAATAKLDLLRGRKRYLEKKVRGINKKLKGKLKPPVREKLLQQRESYLGELASLPGEASGLIENLREAGEGPKALRKAARGFGIGTRDPNAEKITARDRADLQLARAEMTPGKEDDLEALKRLVDVSKQELKVAKKSGDPKKIAEATRNLTEATQNLKEALPTAQDFANRDLAMAELTETLSDDQAALEAMIALDEQQLAAALQTPDPRDDIEAAQNLRAHRDALKSLKDSVDTQNELSQQRQDLEKERIEVEKKQIQLAETQGPAFMAAFAAWIDGAIGGPTRRRMGLPATPGVAAGYQ